MLRIGIVGCGLQAATIAGHLGIYGDAYEVASVMDTDFEHAKAMIAKKEVVLSKDCRFHGDLDAFVADAAGLDGFIVGTPCAFHTEVACKLEPFRKPIHLEKPVAITLEQYRQLHAAFKDSPTPVQVSLPMRVCPLAMEAKRIIASGEIGTVEQVVGREAVGGDVYYSTWYRDFAKTGGMFLQKAVHDLDYMFHLAGSRPRQICAMSAQRVFGGDKPFDLRCAECADQQDCPESPASRFQERGWGKSVNEGDSGLCRFSQGIKIDDIGECVVELENGAQLSHTQNFIVNHDAMFRGAFFHGYKGTLAIDFHAHSLKVMSHWRRKTAAVDMPYGPFNHYDGDKELVRSFLITMKTGERAPTDLIHANGADSTLACLLARESARQRKFIGAAL